MSLRTRLAGSVAALMLATTVAAQDAPSADTVLASVNGTEITVGHVIALVSRLPERFQNLADEDLYNGVLEQLIQQTALGAGMDRDTRSVELAIENEVRALLATERLKIVEAGAVTEEAIEAAYAEQYTNAPAEQEWKSQHILVETEEEAKAVVEELESGADFGELAKEKSTGPSGPNGGDLGWQGKGRLVPAFEAAMIALAPGGISAPVQTQFGWHVIKLNEVRETPKPPLVEVRAEIVEALKEAAVAAELTATADAAEITRSDAEIDPSIIRQTELLD